VRRREHAREAGLPGALTTSLYRIVLAYDGTDFEGWQVQSSRRPSGAPARTVQGELESALRKLDGGAPVRVKGAGRTDAGVHALGQVASFELARAIEPAALQRALNGLLSPEIRVREAAHAAPGFDARRSAVNKLYRYELDTGPVQLPTRRRQAGHVPLALDRARVAETAALYLGRHDFASLCSSGGSAKTTVRTLTRSDAAWEGDTLVYEAEAEGFLRKMVRSLVGGLIAAGRGAVSVEDLRQALGARDRRAWPAPADARGLTLVRVDYPPEPPVLT
jgi:tRNA pseudouridine38-40 synthase